MGLALASFALFTYFLSLAYASAFLCGFLMILVSRSKKLEQKSSEQRRYRFSFARLYFMYVRTIEKFIPRFISDIVILLFISLVAFGVKFTNLHLIYILGGVYFFLCESMFLPRGLILRDQVNQMGKFLAKTRK